MGGTDMIEVDIEPMAQFWAFSREGRLCVPQCGACGHVWWPPSRVCPECLSRSARWIDDSGKGTIWSFVEYHRAYRKALGPHVPYNVVLVELDSGVRLIARIVDSAIEDIRIGQRVEVDFRPIFDEEDPIPVFKTVET